MTFIKPMALAMSLSGKVLFCILMTSVSAVCLVGMYMIKDKRLDFLISSIATLFLTCLSLFLAMDELAFQLKLMFPNPSLVANWDGAYLFLANGILLLLTVPFGIALGEGICLTAFWYFKTGDVSKAFRSYGLYSQKSFLSLLRILRKVRALGM